MADQVIVKSGVEGLNNGMYRVSVDVSNVPKNLFGVGFTLKIGGGSFELARHGLGDVFVADSPSGIVSFADYRKDASGVVFGVSMLRGTKYVVGDGRLVSFDIRPVGKVGDTVTVAFENGFLSGFDGSERFDISGVSFQGGSFASSSASMVTGDAGDKVAKVDKSVNDGKVALSGLNIAGVLGTQMVAGSVSASVTGTVSDPTGRMMVVPKDEVEFDQMYLFLGIMFFLSMLFLVSFFVSGRLMPERSSMG